MLLWDTISLMVSVCFFPSLGLLSEMQNVDYTHIC